MNRDVISRKAIRIVQVSDCHLPGDRMQSYRGINPHDNLGTLMERVRNFEPDLLLASGDLSEDGSAASYQGVKACLDLPLVPVLALPGNHDDPVLLAEYFPGSPVDSISVTDHSGWRLVRLNSCLPGRPEGRVSDAALEDLENFLDGPDQRPVIIALHHQPVFIGSPWIDKYSLINPERMLALIKRHESVRAVTWGHIHQVFDADRDGTRMLGCPSSAINGQRDAQRFSADTLGPAARWLDLYDNGSLKTGILTIKAGQA
jgi:Icc protein